jgi:hypothetical protein
MMESLAHEESLAAFINLRSGHLFFRAPAPDKTMRELFLLKASDIRGIRSEVYAERGNDLNACLCQLARRGPSDAVGKFLLEMLIGPMQLGGLREVGKFVSVFSKIAVSGEESLSRVMAIAEMDARSSSRRGGERMIAEKAVVYATSVVCENFPESFATNTICSYSARPLKWGLRDDRGLIVEFQPFALGSARKFKVQLRGCVGIVKVGIRQQAMDQLDEVEATDLRFGRVGRSSFTDLMIGSYTDLDMTEFVIMAALKAAGNAPMTVVMTDELAPRSARQISLFSDRFRTYQELLKVATTKITERAVLRVAGNDWLIQNVLGFVDQNLDNFGGVSIEAHVDKRLWIVDLTSAIAVEPVTRERKIHAALLPQRAVTGARDDEIDWQHHFHHGALQPSGGEVGLYDMPDFGSDDVFIDSLQRTLTQLHRIVSAPVGQLYVRFWDTTETLETLESALLSGSPDVAMVRFEEIDLDGLADGVSGALEKSMNQFIDHYRRHSTLLSPFSEISAKLIEEMQTEAAFYVGFVKSRVASLIRYLKAHSSLYAAVSACRNPIAF